MLTFTNRRTINTYSYKYITKINNKNFEILSNLDEKTFETVLKELSVKWKEINTYEIVDCIEFEYTNENTGIGLDVLKSYL